MYLFFCQYLILASETFDRLMTEASRGLVKRHVVAINEYFQKISDDCLLALAVNPVLATHGCVEIIALRTEDGDGEEIVARAKKLLKEEVQRVTEAMKLVAEEAASESEGN